MERRAEDAAVLASLPSESIARTLRATSARDAGQAPEALEDRLGFLLNQAAERIRAGTAVRLVPLELTPRLFGVIEAIGATGPVTQRALGQRLGIDRTTTVQILDALEARGWVRRGPHARDRRCHSLVLTAKGQRLWRNAALRVKAAQDDFAAPLSSSAVRSLRQLLRRLVRPESAVDARCAGRSGRSPRTGRSGS